MIDHNRETISWRSDTIKSFTDFSYVSLNEKFLLIENFEKN